MKRSYRLMMLLPLVAVAACSKPNTDLSGGVGTGLSPAGMATTVAPSQQSSVGVSSLSPTSPAFFSQNVGDRVLFEVDQFTLNGTAQSVLDGQAAWILSNPAYQITIEGHADEQGTREYNLALGARRAQAVNNYLLSKGVPASRLRTVSFGKEKLIEICSASDCHNKNRRAVTVLAGGIS